MHYIEFDVSVSSFREFNIDCQLFDTWNDGYVLSNTVYCII